MCSLLCYSGIVVNIVESNGDGTQFFLSKVTLSISPWPSRHSDEEAKYFNPKLWIGRCPSQYCYWCLCHSCLSCGYFILDYIAMVKNFSWIMVDFLSTFSHSLKENCGSFSIISGYIYMTLGWFSLKTEVS